MIQPTLQMVLFIVENSVLKVLYSYLCHTSKPSLNLFSVQNSTSPKSHIHYSEHNFRTINVRRNQIILKETYKCYWQRTVSLQQIRVNQTGTFILAVSCVLNTNCDCWLIINRICFQDSAVSRRTSVWWSGTPHAAASPGTCATGGGASAGLSSLLLASW